MKQIDMTPYQHVQIINNGATYSNQQEEWDLLPEVKELYDLMEKINAQPSELDL